VTKSGVNRVKMWQVNVEVPASTSRLFVRGDLPHEKGYLNCLWIAKSGVFPPGMENCRWEYHPQAQMRIQLSALDASSKARTSTREAPGARLTMVLGLDGGSICCSGRTAIFVGLSGRRFLS